MVADITARRLSQERGQPYIIRNSPSIETFAKSGHKRQPSQLWVPLNGGEFAHAAAVYEARR